MDTLPDRPPPMARAAEPLSAWELEQEPVSLFVLMPGDRPTPLAVKEQFERAAGIPCNHHSPLEPHAGVEWACTVEHPQLNQPVLFWCEPAQPLPAGEIADGHASACRWTVGVQYALDLGDPPADFALLLHLLAKAFADAPAIFDADAGRWHLRSALDRFAVHPFAVPANELLWTVHCVTTLPAPVEPTDDAGPGGCSRATSRSRSGWVHTHGMARCGVPDIEMLEVPPHLAPAAAEFLNLLAELMMELGTPAPGQSVEIGDSLRVHCVPWQLAIQQMAAEELGGAGDPARADSAHTGCRAVLRTENLVELLTRVHTGEARILMSDRAALRRARLAQHFWPDLQRAYNRFVRSASRPTDASFLVKADTSTRPTVGRPDQWCRVLDIHADGVSAQPLDQSPGSPPRPSQPVIIDPAQVADWRIHLHGNMYSPGQPLP